MTVSGDTEVRRSTVFTENLTSQYNKNTSILEITLQRATEIIKGLESVLTSVKRQRKLGFFCPEKKRLSDDLITV